MKNYISFSPSSEFLGKTFRQEREKQGLKSSQLASQLGCSYKSIDFAESGTFSTRSQVMGQLYRHYKLHSRPETAQAWSRLEEETKIHVDEGEQKREFSRASMKEYLPRVLHFQGHTPESLAKTMTDTTEVDIVKLATGYGKGSFRKAEEVAQALGANGIEDFIRQAQRLPEVQASSLKLKKIEGQTKPLASKLEKVPEVQNLGLQLFGIRHGIGMPISVVAHGLGILPEKVRALEAGSYALSPEQASAVPGLFGCKTREQFETLSKRHPYVDIKELARHMPVLRKERGITLETLASKLELSEFAVKGFERGETEKLTTTQIARLPEIFGAHDLKQLLDHGKSFKKLYFQKTEEFSFLRSEMQRRQTEEVNRQRETQPFTFR